jgi:hypothetical protein
MLPSWLNDFGTLLTIITGVPVVLGWIIGWLGQGAPQPTLQPSQRQRVTLYGLIKTGIFHSVRPCPTRVPRRDRYAERSRPSGLVAILTIV